MQWSNTPEQRRRALDLVARGANPSYNRSAAFVLAIGQGDLQILNAFARVKAPLPPHPFATDRIYGDQPALFRWLVAHGAKPDFDALQNALRSEGESEQLTQILLDGGADPNAGGWWDYFNGEREWATPLMVAATQQSEGPSIAHFPDGRLIKMLLARGARINERAKGGGTALDNAVREESSVNARVLLQNGADVKPALAPKLLQMAAGNGRSEPLIIDELAKRKLLPVKPSFAALDFPAASELVKRLLAHGADPKEANAKGWTPLHAAAKAGEIESVKMLLDAGANIEAKGTDPSIAGTMLDGATPLFAADTEHLIPDTPAAKAAYPDKPTNNPAQELLLTRGANPNARDKNGVTPLMFAALASDRGGGSEEAARLLCAHGADLLSKDKAGNTALHYAALWSGPIVKTLVRANSSPAFLEARDADGNTSFLVAVSTGGYYARPYSNVYDPHTKVSFPVIEALLQSPANRAARDNEGNTAFHLAVSDERLALLRGANVPGWDAPNNAGVTPLYKACFNGDVEAARFFLHCGATPDFKSKNGLSPRAVASRAFETGALPLYRAAQRRRLDQMLRLYAATPEQVSLYRKEASAHLKPVIDAGRKQITALIRRAKPLPNTP